MIRHESGRDPVEALAAEFLERFRKGERPTVEEYTERYPELAAGIRDLFPTIAALEGWKLDKVSSRPRIVPANMPRPEYLGDFRIIREIGRGGMGIVYEAEQESLGRRVAVKVLPRGPLLGEKQLQRFDREAKTAARLHHTNIVQVFGVGKHEDIHYYVMQYIRGAGLDQVLDVLRQDRKSNLNQAAAAQDAEAKDDVHSGSFSPGAAAAALRTGRFSCASKPAAAVSVFAEDSGPGVNGSKTDVQPVDGFREQSANGSGRPASDPEAKSVRPGTLGQGLSDEYWRSIARLGIQVAGALDYAHSQGILHRDIKPANLLLDGSGTVWVTDFGLAKAVEAPGVSETGDLVGTLLYMAPEQFEGTYDGRSDIYSLGVTLRELLTLEPLFDGSNRNQLIRQITQGEPLRPRKLNPRIPRDLETIVLKATARERHERYVTARDLLDDLENFLEDRPVKARQVSYAERFWRWRRRNKALANVGALALALLFLVALTASLGFVTTRNALQRAEKTSELAEEAFERIFKQLAPKRLVAAAELTLEAADGQDIEIPVQASVSKDSALLLEQLLVYYDRLAEQSDNDAKLRAKKAHASRRVGDIRARLGELEEARKAYEQAAAIYGDLQRELPADTQVSLELARVDNALGQVLARQMQFREAHSAHQSAIRTLGSAPPGSDERALVNYELAQSYYWLAKSEIRLGPPGPRPGKGPGKGDRRGPRPPRRERNGSGKNGMGKNGFGPKPPGPPPFGPPRASPEGIKYLETAVKLLQGLLQQQPNVPAYRHLLALCYREMSGGRFFGGGGNASGTRDEAVKLLRRLVEEHPDVPDYRYELIETLALIDVPPWQLAKAGINQERFKEALDLSRELVRQHPNVPDYLMSRNRIHMTLGQVQMRGGDWEGAEGNFREALKVQESIMRMDAKLVFHPLFKTLLERSLAEVLRLKKDYKKAAETLEPSLGRLEKLLAEHRELGFVHMSLADGYEQLAEIYRAMNDEGKAAAAVGRAHDHRQSFAPRK